jgi:hypothetical protein
MNLLRAMAMRLGLSQSPRFWPRRPGTRVARELSVGAEDEDVRHRVVPSLMTRIALSVRG